MPELTIEGPLYVCRETEATFFLKGDVEGEVIWSFTGDHEIGEDPYQEATVRWYDLGSFMIKISIDGRSVAEFQVTVVEAPRPEIIGISSIYAGETYSYYATKNYDFTNVFWNVQNGTIISGQNTEVIQIQWASSGGSSLTLVESLPNTECSGSSESLSILRLSTSASFNSKRALLQTARSDRDDADQNLYLDREQKIIKEQALENALREDPNASNAATQNLQNDIAQLEIDIARKLKLAYIHQENVKNHQRQVCNDSLENQVSNLSDTYPIALFPLKIQTKFKKTGEAYTLKVRFYPDDIHLEGHEPELTAIERQAGQDYWTELSGATTENERKAAWNALASGFSPQRAAWIVIKTDPLLDPSDEVGEKSSDWTRRHMIRLLPDRFVVTLYRSTTEGGNYTQLGAVESNLVTDKMEIGLNPHDDDSIRQEGTDTDHVIHLGDDQSWLQDFDKAVEIGMGVQIDMPSMSQTATDVENGYYKLIVAGVRVSTDESGSKDLIEANFNNHHYTDDGMRLLKIKTPTSNTDILSTPYRRKDIGHKNSYAIERQSPLFTNYSHYLTRRDGQRLAEALGISDEVLHHIHGAQHEDIRKALINNQVWSSSTVGKKMRDLWGYWFSMEDVDNTRNFFKNYVVARGILPTILVDDQPYGVMPVSAFGEWIWDEGNEADEYPFLEGLRGTLENISTVVDGLVPNVPKVGKAGDNAQEALLHSLSQQAVSAKLKIRTALGPDLVYNSLSFNNKLESANSWYSSMKTRAESKMEALGMPTGEGQSIPKAFMLSHKDANGAINKGLLQNERLSESSPVKELAETGQNYFRWLADSNFADIRGMMVEGNPMEVAPDNLIFKTSREAVMNEYWFAAYKLAQNNGVENLPWETPEFEGVPDPGTEEYPEGLSAADVIPNAADPWSLMDMQVAEVHEEMTLAEYLDSEESNSIPEKADLDNSKSALSDMANYPSAEVDQLIRETLDANSYRLDGWQLGMVNYRLEKMRYGSGSRTYGSYIGAYGYVEDLKVNTDRSYLDSSEKTQIGESGDIEKDARSKGFVHAPTLNHATAAAILKSAYDPIKDKEWGSDAGYPRRINLNSGRVRKAQAFMEGLSAGQELSGMLGYEFERGLQESTLQLDVYIYYFRRAFPTQEITNYEEEPTETIEASNVVDGYTLYNTVKQAIADEVDYPYGLDQSQLPNPGTAESDFMTAQILNLGEIVDAIHDLAVSESVYQLVQGKVETAGSIMENFEKGEFMKPDFQVTETPRNKSVFNQKLALHFNPASTSAAEWGVASSYRSELGPTLNAWIADQIPNPDGIIFSVSIKDQIGEPAEVDTISNWTIGDLEIQPIDLLYIYDSSYHEVNSALSNLIRYKVKVAQNLTQNAEITIDYKTPHIGYNPNTERSFEQAEALLEHIKKFIINSRVLKPVDFLLEYEIEDGSLDLSLGYDLSELGNRVQGALDALQTLKENLEYSINEVTDEQYQGDLATDLGIFRGYLFEMHRFNIMSSLPESVTEVSQEAYDQILAKSQALLVTLQQKYNEANTKWSGFSLPGNVSPDTKQDLVDLAREVGHLIFGDAFQLIPRFKFYNPVEMSNCFQDSTSLLPSDNADAAEEVLTSVACVRPRVSEWDISRILSEEYSQSDQYLYPIQLPYTASDKWYAVPHEDPIEMEESKYSIIIASPANSGSFNANLAHAGLIIDEWTESIPQREVSTSLTYHKDEPGSNAANCILLAVTPEETGNWQWDHLVKTIDETFRLAKRRAAGPELIAGTELADLTYPMVITESGQENGLVGTF